MVCFGKHQNANENFCVFHHRLDDKAITRRFSLSRDDASDNATRKCVTKQQP
jgi:hypothetical protein